MFGLVIPQFQLNVTGVGHYSLRNKCHLITHGHKVKYLPGLLETSAGEYMTFSQTTGSFFLLSKIIFVVGTGV
jgi:hypothetical protein